MTTITYLPVFIEKYSGDIGLIIGFDITNTFRKCNPLIIVLKFKWNQSF